MRKLIRAVAAITVLSTFCCVAAFANDAPDRPTVRLLQLARGNDLPRGSYQQSCTCQMSGGIRLMCFCNNLKGKMFETEMDVRNCPLPKDIRNCNGKLKCLEPKGGEC